MRGDNAREAVERFVAEDDELTARVLIGGVPVDVAPRWGRDVRGLIRQLRRAVEELIREREEAAAEAAAEQAEVAERLRWRTEHDDD